MSKNTRLNFSPVLPLRHRSIRGGDRRLMLGLTARRIRIEPVVWPTSAADSTVSGLPRSTPFLDRLSSPLTRYRD